MKILSYIVIVIILILIIGYCTVIKGLRNSTWGGWTPQDTELAEEQDTLVFQSENRKLSAKEAIEKRKPIQILSKEREVKDLKKNVKKEITTSINAKYIGTFSIYLETEETMTGMASIDYTFSITNEFIQLKTNTYHEPILCNGAYKAVEKNHILELYYIGKDEFCDTVNPMFFLREEGGELYAKGLGGEGTYHNWIELKRI